MPLTSEHLKLIELEKTIDWHAPERAGSFLLPGELEIDMPTMRRRTTLYYRQFKGRSPSSYIHGRRVLANVLTDLADHQ